ncbi:MAG: hypothetical protein AMS24_02605 [Chlamydiae bacterium SM23_39]|nr:MAG: hypothetical protein AMS24_02605 [Chlamydiae bacterium SM23_39]
MKILKGLLSWLPWISFSIISNFSVSSAIIVSIIFSLFSYSKLKKGFILEWTTLLFLTSCFISMVIFKNDFFIRYKSIFAETTLASISWISILIKHPFTEQYAKLQVPKEYWNSFLFLRINKIMTAIFAIIFSLKTLISIYSFYNPKTFNFSIFFWLILCLQCIFVHKFPSWYKKRYKNKLLSQKQS